MSGRRLLCGPSELASPRSFLLSTQTRRKTIAKERKEALEERRRLEEAAAKVRKGWVAAFDVHSTYAYIVLPAPPPPFHPQMSAKKLQRLKKRLNRTKKVSG